MSALGSDTYKRFADRADLIAVIAHLSRLMGRQDQAFKGGAAESAALVSTMCAGYGFDDQEIAREAMELAARMESKQ